MRTQTDDIISTGDETFVICRPISVNRTQKVKTSSWMMVCTTLSPAAFRDFLILLYFVRFGSTLKVACISSQLTNCS